MFRIAFVVVLAFAGAAKSAERPAQFPAAPKQSPCDCGPGCKCPAGVCPLGCPQPSVVASGPGWSVTGTAVSTPPGCVWVYWEPLKCYAHVHESLLPKARAAAPAYQFAPPQCQGGSCRIR